MFSLRTHAIICGSLFATMFILAAGGNALIAAGVFRQPATPNLVAMALFFALFLACGFSAVPVIVMLVLRVQTQLGNERIEAIRRVVAAQTVIIWAIWGLMLAGTVIAVPAAIMNGALSAQPAGPSQAK